MKKKIFFQLLVVLLSISNYVSAQIGINTVKPNALTELEITNLIDSEGKIIDPKGIMVPRMSEADRDSIKIQDPGTANSLLIYNTDEDCYNYFSKEDEEWKSLCGKLGNAKFTPIDCSAITVYGQYTEGKTVDASNYISINVNVEKIGNYIISGTTGNGYSFYFTGAVLEKGNTTINVPAQGKPVAVQKDYLTLSGIPLSDLSCEPEIVVNPSIATFDLNCGTVSVNGQYLKNNSLTSDNTIQIRVLVQTEGSYRIYTPVVNGISFESKGVFLSSDVGSQKIITLAGASTPSINKDITLSIYSNSLTGNNVCETVVPVTLPKMTYAVVGADNVWSWGGSVRRNSITQQIKPGGVVDILGFTQLWSESNGSNVANRLKSGSVLPDVILCFTYGMSNASSATSALVEYINKGGCVIYGPEESSTAANLLVQGIFGTAYGAQSQIAGSSTTDDNTYKVSDLQDDPIINGPFGNAAGWYWGEDNVSTGTSLVPKLPSNSVQICTAYNPYGKMDVNPEYSVLWYNDQTNFVFFGDCVGAASSGGDLTTRDTYPAIFPVANSYAPSNKLYGNYPNHATNAQFCYNSILEMNALAWSIRQAAISGVNPH